MRPELSEASWSNFRRELIEKDREAFDEIANKARLHIEAITNAAFQDSMECALVSILLENEKELRKLRTR
jgi:hypothetical protein